MFSRSAGFSSIAVAFLSSSGFLISHLTWASVTCELFILSLPEDHHHLMLCELTALVSEAETDVNFHNRCMSFRVKLMDLQAWSGASETGDNVAGLPNCPSRQLVFYTVIWVCSLPNCPWPGWNISGQITWDSVHVHQTDFFSERLSVLRGRLLSVGLFLLLPRLCSLPNCFWPNCLLLDKIFSATFVLTKCSALRPIVFALLDPIIVTGFC